VTEAAQRRWFWATLVLSSITMVALVFACWELVENRFFRDADYLTLHYLYITRGIASSLLLALWAAWFVLRQRRQSEDELRRSREHYHGLLEASPGAVVLYDSDLIVSEWNATAERLYGWSRERVLGQRLPCVPAQELERHRALVGQVLSGERIELETARQTKEGLRFPVQLKLLPYAGSGSLVVLEVAEDIRDKVRLREQMVEMERLRVISKMAAGTAHHLNSPLAAMLLRVQMMRQRQHTNGCAADLVEFEQGLEFCRHFVQSLLDFSRRPPAERSPQPVEQMIRTVVGFLSPTAMVKQASIVVENGAGKGERAWVLAERNQLETLFLILLGNALDAVQAQGTVQIGCRPLDGEFVEVAVRDDGSGVAPGDLPRVFEPFFTTKPPGKGTGLGLTMARNIVLQYGGAIDLSSQPGRGTTVAVRLPTCPAASGSLS
jgi:PAS domain S-box-containing protein